MEVVQKVDKVSASAGIAVGGGVLQELRGGTVQTAGVSGVTERGLVTGRGMACRRGPEIGRGHLVVSVTSTVLVEVVREPVQRHAHNASLATSRLLTTVPGTGSGGAGSGRTRTDAGQRPADALAGTAV